MDKKNDSRIAFIENWMKSNLNTKYTNKEIAYLVNLSNSHFQELFKVEIGKTPKKYLQDLRMEKAKELLEKTYKSIKEICSEVGINDQRDFSRDFKRKYGVLPTHYDKRYGNKGEKE